MSRAAYKKRWAESNRVKTRGYGRKYNRTIKLEALSHYGKNGKPQCCWRLCKVLDLDCLTLDHMADDGAKERRLGVKGGFKLYALLKKSGWPEGYQTLCGNHQLKKEALRRRAHL